MERLLDLKQMHYVVCLAEEGSVTRAARRLNIVQPALSMHIAKLEDGHNAPYWVAKITRNVERDGEQKASLEAEGWLVLRFWESDILKDVARIADEIVAAVKARLR